MKVWKYHPNTYDDNLEKRHDDDSAININPIQQQPEGLRGEGDFALAGLAGRGPTERALF